MINNRCVFIGRLTKDVEVKEKNNKKYAKFQLAVDNGKDKTTGNKRKPTYPSITAFDKIAEHFGKFGKKGTMIAVETRLETGSYEDGGKTVYTNDFIATEFPFLAGGGNQEQYRLNQPPSENRNQPPQQQHNDNQPPWDNSQPGYYGNQQQQHFGNQPQWPNQNQPQYPNPQRGY
ncbi:single-stranded DNA-binding protein [Lysinibacillus xylanilyticus]|uniref:single-stranded DNA-binding protein n=1 Tax=Lysinibacillus xylanilyticus TaxID=582475 RepID=UPI002B23FAE9|nr:single-stranded DNA-binding protein [Lysinibacillus xylanilyticus]MEB2301644.1 single-stranded DNA-binding protein [Lysinibacillus xylanilyticus]